MSRSSRWAFNEFFASPSDAWDTDPTKVEPPPGKIAEGWEPTEEPPAEFLNWWMNRVGETLEELRNIQIATLLQVEDQITQTVGTLAEPSSFWDDGTWVYLCGDFFSGGVRRSPDGVRGWINPTTPGGGADEPQIVAADGAGTVITGADDGEILRSTDFGDTWAVAEIVDALTTDNMDALTWDAAAGLFVIMDSVDQHWTSATGATATWALRSLPGGSGSLHGRFAHATSGPVSGRSVRAAAEGAVWSDDGWITPVNALFTGGGSNFGECCGWTDADGGYFLLGTTDGEVWRSADAVSWTMVAADVGATLASIGAVSGDPFRLEMRSDNRGTWAAFLTPSGGSPKDTYIFSQDAGVTWKAAPYDSAGSAPVIAGFESISFSRGRFFFGCTGNNGQIFNTPTIVV